MANPAFHALSKQTVRRLQWQGPAELGSDMQKTAVFSRMRRETRCKRKFRSWPVAWGNDATRESLPLCQVGGDSESVRLRLGPA